MFSAITLTYTKIAFSQNKHRQRKNSNTPYLAIFTFLDTVRKRSTLRSHSGKSVFIQKITWTIESCSSVRRVKLQPMLSLWNTRFLSDLIELSGAEIFFLCRCRLGIFGNASRKFFHNKRSYSELNSDTQKPRVSSPFILSAVTFSPRFEICAHAVLIYLHKERKFGLLWKLTYQSLRPVIFSNSLIIAFLRVTSNTERAGVNDSAKRMFCS